MDNFDEQISKGVKSFLDKNVEFSNTEKYKILQTIEKRSNRKTKKFYPAYWTVLASAAIIVFILTLSFMNDGAQDSDLAGSGVANGNSEVDEIEKINPCVDVEENLKDEIETNKTDKVAEKEEVSKESTPCEDSEEEKTDNKETYVTETVVDEGNESNDIPVVEKDTETPSTNVTETAVQLKSLPNAEAEAAKWNEVAKDFIARYSEFSYDSSRIHKVEEKSNEEVTIFSHEFKADLKISIEYTVDNKTKEITEMRLVGYELPGVDRHDIYYAMSIFIGYIDGVTSVNQAGNYLAEIPFATNKEGLYENEFNGKRYEYVLDFTDGLNMLTYKTR